MFIDDPFLIGVIYGRIQIDQHVATLHKLPVTNMNRCDDPTLQWLNDFAVAAGNDLALRNRHHIKLAKYRPDDRRDEHRHDGPTDRATDWRRRRVLNLQDGRQKFNGSPVRSSPQSVQSFILPGRSPYGEMSRKTTPHHSAVPHVRRLSLVLPLVKADNEDSPATCADAHTSRSPSITPHA